MTIHTVNEKFGIRRDRVEMYFTLFQTVDVVHKKTQIMYGIGCSYKSACELIDRALEQGWIEEMDPDKKFKDGRTSVRYQLTEKGQRFYRDLGEILLRLYSE